MEVNTKSNVVTVGGRKMAIDRKDCLGLSRSDKFEAYEASFIRDNVQKGWTVIDVGAHIGWHTITLSEAVGPEGKVYAFEPDLENYWLLIENLTRAGCKNVVANRMAVADRTGAIGFEINPRNSGDNHIVPERDDGMRVPCTSLDEFFDEVPRVGFVKMDIQGAEYLAALGMGKILRDQSPILLTELSPRHLRRCGIRSSRYLRLLGSYGYNRFVVVKNGKRRRQMSLARLIGRYLRELAFRECNLLCFKETNQA